MAKRWRQPKERERVRGKSRHGFLPLSSLPSCPSLTHFPFSLVDAPALVRSPEMVGFNPPRFLAKFTAPSIPSGVFSSSQSTGN